MGDDSTPPPLAPNQKGKKLWEVDPVESFTSIVPALPFSFASLYTFKIYQTPNQWYSRIGTKLQTTCDFIFPGVLLSIPNHTLPQKPTC